MNDHCKAGLFQVIVGFCGKYLFPFTCVGFELPDHLLQNKKGVTFDFLVTVTHSQALSDSVMRSCKCSLIVPA